MKITYELLVKKGACEEQRTLFRERYPNGVVLTRELCIGNASDFYFGWAAANLLNKKQWKAYAEAMVLFRKDYEKISTWKMDAWKDHDKAIALAFFNATQI